MKLLRTHYHPDVKDLSTLTVFQRLSLCSSLLFQGLCEAVVDGSCVVMVPRKLNWYQARDNCIQKGGRLLEIHTHAIHDVISSIETGMFRNSRKSLISNNKAI